MTLTLNRAHYPTLNLPEAPGFDYTRLCAAWVPDDPYQPDDGTEAYYRTKAQVSAWVKPTRVVEIGVRAGYSALAFHMGHPFSEFYGMDQDLGLWGGVEGYFAKAAERLASLGLTTLTLERGSSQETKTLPPEAQRADLFHVDGDHTPKGCAHDILLALTNGARYILVDDYDFTEHVADAVDWAVNYCRLTAWYVGDGGYRGNVLLGGRK